MTDDEKRVFLSLVAYGVHSKYQKKLRRSLEMDFKFKSVFIYEYFLEHPVVKGSKKLPISCFEPFLLRILNESRFVPKITEAFPKNWTDIDKLPYKYKNIKKFWNFSSKGARLSDMHKYSFIAKEIFDVWKEEEEPEKKIENGWIKKESWTGIVKANFSYKIDYLRKQYLLNIQNFDDISRIGVLKEYMVSILPWLSCPDIKNLNIAALSISSKNIFYGYILIYYPQLKYSRDIFQAKNKEGSESIRWLKEFIKETYIPILALFENYWEEKQLKEELDTTPDWDKYIFLDSKLRGSSNSIEQGLFKLWNARKFFFENHSPKNEAIEKIRASLLFSKYLVASPEMIDEMKKVIVPRSSLPENSRDRDHLPCVLVIGGPGSGKDIIAQMVRLFFPEYRFGKVFTVNMASLKPSYLSVPLMSGFDAEMSGSIKGGGIDSNINIEAKIKGIFSKIWNQHKKSYPTEDDMQAARKKGVMPVVILDELNSLDIDAQGSLLRIMQNAELQPLGAPEKEEKVDFLVIGVVNEPEDALTMEEPLHRFITEKSIFGGVVGRALYEYFRNIRRLRDDLYYRLVREGRIKLLDLEDRREDIPILFSFFVKKELDNERGDGIGWDNLWFDFDVFEELMDRTISWSGNFRQLQSLAIRTAYNVLQDEDNKKAFRNIESKETNSFIHISLKHIREVMKEFFKKEVL